MGKYSVLDLGILPPFGRADMVDLERNISLYMIALQVIYNNIDNFCACARITICNTRIMCIYIYDSMIGKYNGNVHYIYMPSQTDF